MARKTIETLAWILPRPRMNRRYIGGFPLWFEQKIMKLYDNPEKVLHPFGGMAEYGIRVDLNKDVDPDVIADAHHLPFKDNVFDMVILDPPYSNELSKSMYGTGKIVYKQYAKEAVRVCKNNGFVVVYHYKMLPRPIGTIYHRRILLAVRINHHLRYVGIFQKSKIIMIKTKIMKEN